MKILNLIWVSDDSMLFKTLRLIRINLKLKIYFRFCSPFKPANLEISRLIGVFRICENGELSLLP